MSAKPSMNMLLGLADNHATSLLKEVGTLKPTTIAPASHCGKSCLINALQASSVGQALTKRGAAQATVVAGSCSKAKVFPLHTAAPG